MKANRKCLCEIRTTKDLISFFFSPSDEMEKIKIPKDMDDAKALGTVLSKYKDTYYSQVLVAYFATYVLYPWRKHAPFWKNISQLCFILIVFRTASLKHSHIWVAVIVRCNNSVNLLLTEHFTNSSESSLADSQAPKNVSALGSWSLGCHHDKHWLLLVLVVSLMESPYKVSPCLVFEAAHHQMGKNCSRQWNFWLQVMSYLM